MRCEIISPIWFTGRLFVGTHSFETDLDDFGVAVTPLTLDKIDAVASGEINYYIRFSSRRISICFGKCPASEKN